VPKFKVVSTDSHVSMAPDELVRRVPAEFRDRAPMLRLADSDSEEAQKARRYQERLTSRMTEEDLERHRRMEGRDPALRIKDQDLEGVRGEVIFGPLFFDNSPVPGLDLAVAKAFNNWGAEVFGGHPDRFAVSAALVVADIPAAVDEVYRIAKQGYRCVNLPAQQPRLPYNRSEYDPLWAALQETGIVANFHVGTGHTPQAERGPGGPVINYVLFAQGDGPLVVTYMCASGILQRFPRLKWAVVESGAAWLAWVLQSMDQIYKKHHMWNRAQDELDLLPSEYFKRQGHACFMDDAVAVQNRSVTGAHTILFGTDYPHHEGTFPHTQEVIGRIFAGVPDAETQVMVGGAAAELYGFSLD
jgi:predicted TIM-barrel fold metal-dependent hydrolase